MRAVTAMPKASTICIIAAILLFIVAENVPKLIITNLKPLPVNTSRTIHTTPAPAVFYDPTITCPPSASNDCHSAKTTVQWRTTLHTTKADLTDDKGKKMKDVAELSVTEDLVRTDSNYRLVSIKDLLHLQRGSAHPILDDTSHMTVTANGFGLDFKTGSFARDGLQYFLPFNTERRSYSYFDVFAQAAYPLDYVRTEAKGENPYITSSDVYVFHQEIPVINLARSATRSFTHSDEITDEPVTPTNESDLPAAQQDQIAKMRLEGPRSRFYPDTTAEDDPTIELTPYYTATRTLWVEPTSGVILNQEEEIHLFFATDATDARTTAQSGVNKYRTLLHTSSSWNEATITAAKETATPTVRAMYFLRLGAFLCKYLAGALLIYGIWRFSRRNRTQPTPTTT
ncbi:putative DUF3068 family protein [Corynebacterium mustelae]|uniref:Putative DUF3068 family protein n=2 Tax=Corynebacterium mustelae TaxID=571915 RepID=A0A0G3H2T9_9CORY|nr:putative DUF3068 family protein [Corynebacterium mustelae]